MQTDSPLRWVRRKVFGLTQSEFAALGGVDRSRISRYESGGEHPSYSFLQKIRDEATARGLRLEAEWFFQVPVESERAE